MFKSLIVKTCTFTGAVVLTIPVVVAGYLMYLTQDYKQVVKIFREFQVCDHINEKKKD